MDDPADGVQEPEGVEEPGTGAEANTPQVPMQGVQGQGLTSSCRGQPTPAEARPPPPSTGHRQRAQATPAPEPARETSVPMTRGRAASEKALVLEKPR